MRDLLATFTAILEGLGGTALLTVASFALGAVLAAPLTWARVSSIPTLRFLAGGYIELVRGIPPIVWLFVLYFGLTQFNLQLTSFSAAILGLGVISSGYIAEIYRAGLGSVPGGQQEAAQALSLSRSASFVHVTAPQSLVTVIPLAVAYFIGLLKDSAVASVIGAQDITAVALALSKRSLDGLTIFAIAGLVYLVISFPVAMFGRWLGQKAASRWAVKI
jgi:His/Glu/Gln/Arg/opine family amino acid ABC transporter permease subunit